MKSASLAYKRYSEITLGILIPIDHLKAIDPTYHSPILRGTYCLSIAGLESYFTHLAAAWTLELVNCARLSKDESDFKDSYYSFFRDNFQRRSLCEKKEKLNSDLILHDFSAITLNRPTHIDRLMDFIGRGNFSSNDFWQGVSSRSDMTAITQLQEQLDLIIDRRNHITHGGDLAPQAGLNPISAGDVETVHTLVDSLVLSAENLATTHQITLPIA